MLRPVRGEGCWAAAAAEQGRRWQLNGGGNGARSAAAATGTTVVGRVGSGQGEAVASAAATEAAVGLLPRSSVSSHLRGSSLLSVLK